ncbi:MAG: GNAT family N-acetyltransferase, partial [Chloroflexota bacterium]|nr:GNAT family N-acetyltransferase [Chloroflexota bacterium]
MASSEDGGFFHGTTWAQILADCYGYRPLALLFMSATGELLAGAPAVELRSMALRKRWIALPFSDHCPPLFRDGRRPDIGAALLAELRARRLDRIELRGEVPASGAVATQPRGVRHVLPLTPGPTTLFADMSRMHRRGIKRARAVGVRVLDTTAGRGLDHFVRLHVATRQRLGVPAQPRRFFELLRERVLARGGGFVLTAFIADVPVASGVFLSSGRALLFKFGASDSRYWDSRANHLLAWTAITRACEAGFSAFDLGRSDYE